METLDVAGDRTQVAHRFDDVARPGFAFRADHRRALADAAQRLAEVRRPAHERHHEVPLVHVERLVGRRQDFAFVDVVDAERLQDLCLHEVADAHLRHDRDRDRRHDLFDLVQVRHARDAAFAADVGRHAFERHD